MRAPDTRVGCHSCVSVGWLVTSVVRVVVEPNFVSAVADLLCQQILRRTTPRRGMSSVEPRTPPPSALSCAVCVVGQLARLELESKVRHTLALTLALALTSAL